MSDTKIKLTKESEKIFKERLKTELRTDCPALFPTELPQTSLDVEILAVKTKSFLCDGGLMVQASVSDRKTTWQGWCMYFEKGTESTVNLLPENRGKLHELVKAIKDELNGNLLQINNAADAEEYFLTFVNYCLRGEPELSQLASFPVLAVAPQTSEQVDWLTPLLETEKQRLSEALATHPIDTERKDDYEYVVKACLLVSDELVSYEFGVFCCEKNPSSLYDRASEGEIRLVKKSVLLDGLPDNHRVKPGSCLGFPDIRRTSDQDRWAPIEPDEAILIQRDLMRLLRENYKWGSPPLLCTSSKPVMRRQRLTFYDLDLLEVKPSATDIQSAYVLWRPGYAIPLDSRSNPIHDVNERMAKERGGNEKKRKPLLRTSEDAVEYARFFCQHVWGKHSPFHILDTKQDKTLRALFIACAAECDVQFLESVEATLDSITSPVGMDITTEEGQPAFSVSAHILYGPAIFKVELQIGADGSIEMRDDETLLELPDAQENIKKYWARNRGRKYPDLVESWKKPADPQEILATDFRVPQRTSDFDVGSRGTVEDTIFVGRLRSTRLDTHTFRRCRFRGKVDFSSLVSEGSLTFENCIFENGLTLAHSRLGGTLRISECAILGQLPESLSLEKMSVGALTIDKVMARSGLNARHLQVAGHLHIWNTATSGSLDFYSLTSHSIYFHTVSASDLIDLQNCVVQQFIAMREIHTVTNGDGGINLYGSVVKYNYIALENIHLGGNLSASFLRVGTGVFIHADSETNVIEGSVELGGTVIPQILRISNTNIGKGLELKAIEAGAIRLLGRRLRITNHESATKTDVSSMKYERLKIGGEINLANAVIRHELIFADVCAGTVDVAGGMENSALNLRHARIGGDLRLFLDAEQAKNEQIFPIDENGIYRCELKGGINLENAAIEGDVVLTAVDCGNATINLDDASIQCDLHIAYIGDDSASKGKAGKLTMNGLECHGSADVVGLELGGNIDARFSNFVKQLRVAGRSENNIERSATIRGHLDLTGSAIGELAISVKSFQLDQNEKVTEKLVKERGVILKQALIGKFTAYHNSQQYPSPLDLSYAEIKWWEFCDVCDGGNKQKDIDSVEDYKQLLKGDLSKQLHTYRSIEQHLVNRGQEEGADEIHWEMQKMLYGVERGILNMLGFDFCDTPTSDEKSGWKHKWLRCACYVQRRVLKTLKFAFWAWPISYKAGPYHLLGIIFGWLLVSSWLFSIPSNIAPSEEGLMANWELTAERTPDRQWGLLDGIWMAVRFHVPVALFTARDEWEPRNDGELTVLSSPAVDAPPVQIRHINAEDYGNLVLLVHWMLWPIILITASRKYFRRANS